MNIVETAPQPTDLITHLDTEHGATLALHVDEASVGGILDVSYDDLDADTARLYRLLVVHPGAEFTADPLTTALDLTVADIEQGLTRLEDAPRRHHGGDPEHGHREVRLLPDQDGWPLSRGQPVEAVSTGTVR